MKLAHKLTTEILVSTLTVLVLAAVLSLVLIDDSNVPDRTGKYIISGKVESNQGLAAFGIRVIVFRETQKVQTNAQHSTNDAYPIIARTDDNGKFKIKNIEAGTYTIIMKDDEYATWKRQVSAKDESMFVTLEFTED